MDRRPTIRGDMTFREWIRAARCEEDRAIRYLWCEQQSYSVTVGDYLGCAVGRAPSVVEVVGMPTRKRLRLEVVSGPRVETKFEWKRDLLLPFWNDGRQRRLF